MSEPIIHLSVILTSEERNVLLSFIQSGMKADINLAGLSATAGNIVTNALHLANKLQAATPVEQIKVCPQSEDVTDPVK